MKNNSRIQETLNLLMCEDNSKNIKNQKKKYIYKVREGLNKKTIETLTAVKPTHDPPPLSLTALGFF